LLAEIQYIASIRHFAYQPIPVFSTKLSSSISYAVTT